MKTVYLAAILLLAGTVSCTPAHKIIDLPEWVPEIIGSIREVIGQILDILGIDISEIDIPIQQIVQRILEALGIELDIDWDNLTLEQILEALGIDEIDWENIDFEDILETIIARIQEIAAGIAENINRPVAGSVASIEEYRSVVQVEVGISTVWIPMCSGVIITNFHILSSSSCFSGPLYSAENRRVRAGSDTRYNGGSISAVSTASNNDAISVVRLVNPFVFGNTIATSNIISQDYVMGPSWPVQTVGFGKTTQGNFGISDRDLYAIELIVIDNDACRERWARIPGSSFDVNSNHLCVGRAETIGRDADIRDRGAPYYYQGIVVGIQEWGNFAGNQVFPVVTTSVASYTNWIVAQAV